MQGFWGIWYNLDRFTSRQMVSEAENVQAQCKLHTDPSTTSFVKNLHFIFPMEDDDSAWETIQPSSSASASHSDEDDGDAVVIVTTPTNFTNPPIFAPINHEDLPLFPQPPPDNHHQLPQPPQEPPSPPSSYSSSTTQHPPEVVEGELRQPPEVTNTLLKASLGVLSSWVLRIAYGIRRRIGLWSIASLAAFVTLAAARRWQRWRRLAEKDDADKLLLLLNQKDEKIKELLLQIDRLNKTLSARRRVPVFRVVVDSPLVLGPRLN